MRQSCEQVFIDRCPILISLRKELCPNGCVEHRFVTVANVYRCVDVDLIASRIDVVLVLVGDANIVPSRLVKYKTVVFAKDWPISALNVWPVCQTGVCVYGVTQ